MPKNTAIPIAWRISEPAPDDSTSGTTPMMKAIDVIRIGRRRKRLASIAACTIERPCISSSRANSTIRIAFFADNPTSTIKPICVKMLLSPSVSHTPSIADRMLIGTIMMIANGSVRLSYIAASTRNTSSTLIGKIQSAALPARICWYVRSVHSNLIPRGSVSAAMRSAAACAWPDE